MAEFAAERRMGKTRNSYTLGERTRLRTNAQICRDLSDFRAEGASLVAQFGKEGRVAKGVQFERAAGEQLDDPQVELRAQFRERIRQGTYDALLDPSVRMLLREGAAIRGMDEELGAIRFALAKLLAEELDASKLAAGVARLTSAAVQAMKIGQALGDETDESLADLLNEILIDLEKESQVARAARKEGGGDRAWRQDLELADTG